MSNGINTGLAFLAGAALVDSVNNDVNNFKTDLKMKALQKQINDQPVQVGVTPESRKRIDNIVDQLAENRKECDAKIAENKNADNLIIGALRGQVQETRELAHAWEERAVVLEAKKDSWFSVVKNLLSRGEITITKDEVNKRYLESYDPLVETNLSAMRAKHQSR